VSTALLSFPAILMENPPGGWTSNVYMWKQLEDIHKYLDCDFLCLFPDGFERKEVELDFPRERVFGVPVPSTSPPYIIKNIFLIKKQINSCMHNRDYKYLILFEPLLVNLMVFSIFRMKGAKIITWICGNHGASSLFNIKLSKNITRKIKSYIDYYITENIIKYLIRHSDMIITDNPVYLQNKTPGLFAPSHTMDSHDLLQLPVAAVGTKPVISLLFVGRVVPIKGVYELVSALSEIKNSLSLHLTIVGSLSAAHHDGYELRIRELIQKQDLSRFVTFSGNVSDRKVLENYYLNADIFVLPSLTEGTPKAMLEAMAYGLPIIASRVGGIPEIIRDGVEGVLVTPQDQEGLVNALKHLAQDRQLLTAMGQAARARSRCFTKDLIFQKITEKILSINCE
jgi:glycosyltransferase involved in cell wall biosynthesis